MARGPRPRDHRGIAEAPESGTRPLPASGSPTEPLPVAPAAPRPTPNAAAPPAAPAPPPDPRRRSIRHSRTPIPTHREPSTATPGGTGVGTAGATGRARLSPARARSCARRAQAPVAPTQPGQPRARWGVRRRVAPDRDRRHLGPRRLRPGVHRQRRHGPRLRRRLADDPDAGTVETTIFSRAIKDKHGIRLVARRPDPAADPHARSSRAPCTSPYIGFISWPTLIAVGLLVLIWRNANDSEKQFIDHEVVPLLGTDFHGRGAAPAHHPDRRRRRHRRARHRPAGRGAHERWPPCAPSGARRWWSRPPSIVFGPWWLSLVRDLIAERQARVRAEDRAQMAAHVHDSVLQTLALIQRSSDDPQNVRATGPGPRARAAGVALRGPFARASSARTPRCSARASPSCSARWRRTTASPSRSSWSVTASWTSPCAPCSTRRARPPSTRPSGPGADQVVRLRRGRDRLGRALRARPGPGLRPGVGAGGPPWHRPIDRVARRPLRRRGRHPFGPRRGAEVQLFMPRRERVK